MTYLLSQIFVSLLLAAVAGGALGWILHGIKAHRRERELAGLLNRHASALTQAQQERQMIADDYDEMKLGLESRIGQLQLENRKLPELEDNLEKSQQLVQNMMKTHKSELSETQAQSEQLKSELENLRVQQKNDHSEISALRKTNAELGGNNNLGVSNQAIERQQQTTRKQTEATPAASDTNKSIEPELETSAGNQLNSQSSENTAHQRADSTAHRSASSRQTASREPVSSPATENNPIDESALNTAATQAELLELESEIEEMRGYNRDHSVPAIEVTRTEESRTQQATAQAKTRPAADKKAVSSAATAASITTSPASSTTATTTPATSTATDLRNRFQSAGKDGEADDLQTIHGIGPVIEKSLNDLGIINYRQIAELTRREVEEIAEILEIFPGRIERDNWIGTARKLAGDSLHESVNESMDQTKDNKDTDVKDTDVRKERVSPALQAEEV